MGKIVNLNSQYITKEEVDINELEENIDNNISTSINEILNEVNTPLYKVGRPNNSVEETVKKSHNINIVLDKVIEKIDEEKIDLYLQNLWPYFIGGNYKDMVNNQYFNLKKSTSMFGNYDSLKSSFFSLKGLYDKIIDVRYFTAPELAKIGAANFYTIRLLKGTTVKKEVKEGSLGKEFDGSVDLDFGINEYDKIYKEIKKIKKTIGDFLFGKGRLDSNDNIILENKKEDYKEERSLKIIEDRKSGKYTTVYDIESVPKYLNVNKDIENSYKNRFIRNGDNFQIGAIYVMPIQNGTNLENFYIPFEFNPVITESGMSAQYQAQTVLSRIGALQSFTGVNNNTITLTTTYLAMSDGIRGIENDSWMYEMTMEKIQGIEMAYRSLTLPTFPDEESEEGYKYVKPPLVRVIMGNKKIEGSGNVFNNLLTYTTKDVFEGKLKSVKSDTDKLYKNFIVTNVVINKNMDAQPLYIDEETKTIMDTFGFEVTLNLTEVTPSYLDKTPDFRSYYNAYMKVN